MFEELAALPPGPLEVDKVFAICRGHGVRLLQPVEPGKEDLGGV